MSGKWKKIIVAFFVLAFLINISPANFVGSEKSGNLDIFHPTDDAQISQNGPSNNYGSLESMSVRNEYGGFPAPYGDGWARDCLIKFDISSLSLPPGTHVYAKLKLYYYMSWDNDPAGRELNIYRITSDWNEENVTWDTQPSCCHEKTASSVVPVHTDTWMEWDVSSDVEKFIDGEEKNYGWIIMDEKPWGDVDIPITYFRTKEYGSYVPTLEIIVDNIPPALEITHPGHGLYIYDRKILPMPFTVVIGPITVQAFASDKETGIQKVEFYSDGTLKSVSYNQPYEWVWNETAVGLHKIKVEAYDWARNVNSKTERILIFSINS